MNGGALLRVGWAYLRGAPVVAAGPLRVWIEPTAACNLHCAFCPTGLGEVPPGQLLPAALFLRLLAQLPPATSVNLHHRGEPTLHPETPAFAGALVRAGHLVRLHTNGTRLRPELRKRLLESRLQLLSISFDGPGREEYERLRAGASHAQVSAAVRALLAERSGPLPRIQVEVIAFGGAQDGPLLQEEARALFRPQAPDRIEIRSPHNWGGMQPALLPAPAISSVRTPRLERDPLEDLPGSQAGQGRGLAGLGPGLGEAALAQRPILRAGPIPPSPDPLPQGERGNTNWNLARTEDRSAQCRASATARTAVREAPPISPHPASSAQALPAASAAPAAAVASCPPVAAALVAAGLPGSAAGGEHPSRQVQVEPPRVRPRPCPHLWSTLAVCADGVVTPCPQDYRCKLKLGDLRLQTLDEIWNGTRLQELRRLHAAGRSGEIDPCRDCDVPLRSGREGPLRRLGAWFAERRSRLGRGGGGLPPCRVQLSLCSPKKAAKLEALRAALPPLGRWLEIGAEGGVCGWALRDGRAWVRLEEDAGARRFGSRLLGQEIGPLERLETLASGSFDGILLADHLEHVQDDLGLLRTCRRLLKDEGVLVVTVPVAGRRLYALRRRLGLRDQELGHLREGYRLPELSGLLESAGLRVEGARGFAGPLAEIAEAILNGLHRACFKGNGRPGWEYREESAWVRRGCWWLLWPLRALRTLDRTLGERKLGHGLLLVARPLPGGAERG